ncbi:MAG: hypothetical protein JXR94_15345, partial [Candidatus Hydrogenedentes bacterium]|nr:hypothetical protein [Candidatus Hydrogenedentota bacterium]
MAQGAAQGAAQDPPQREAQGAVQAAAPAQAPAQAPPQARPQAPPQAPARPQRPAMELPQLDQSRMTIPWSEFKGLLEKLQAAIEAEEPGPPPPPFEWTVSGAQYEAEAVEDSSVHVVGTLDITVLKPEGWVAVPVVGETVAPASARLDGRETPLTIGDKGRLEVAIDTPGTHTFQVECYVPCVSEDGVVRFEFPCPRTPLTRMRLSIPTADATVRSPEAAHVAVTRRDTGVTADLVFKSTDRLAVSWTLPALLRKREAAKPAEPPRVTSLTSTLASITDRYLVCESRLHYDVLRGGVDTFRLRFPATVNVLAVTGQGAGWTRTEEDGAQVIEVKVNHRIEDAYELAVRYEEPFDEEMATLRVPDMALLDVARETGFIGVAAQSNVEVSASAEVEALTRVDISELPVAVRSMSANPLLLGYKYTEHPFLLAVDVRKLEDVPVRVAAIDRAALTTTITEEGMALTRAVYLVRNNVKQFLRIDLGKGAQVWGAEVGDRVVKPAQDGENGAVLIPLFKSVETNRQLGAFPVAITYMQPIDSPAGALDRLDLVAPATDILANELSWDVLLPESQRVYRSKGDLKPLRA